MTAVTDTSLTITTKGNAQQTLTLNEQTVYEKQSASHGKKHSKKHGSKHSSKHGKKQGKKASTVPAAQADVQPGTQVSITANDNTATKVLILEKSQKHHGKHHGKKHRK